MGQGQAVGGTDPIEALIDFLTPLLHAIPRRLEGERFTTGQFIAVPRSDPAAAYAV